MELDQWNAAAKAVPSWVSDLKESEPILRKLRDAGFTPGEAYMCVLLNHIHQTLGRMAGDDDG